MINWLHVIASRQYKNFCVLHLERNKPPDARINAATAYLMARIRRALGGPRPAKLGRVLQVHVPNHQDVQAYRQPIGGDDVPY